MDPSCACRPKETEQPVGVGVISYENWLDSKYLGQCKSMHEWFTTAGLDHPLK